MTPEQQNPANIDPRTISDAELSELSHQLHARCCNLNVSIQLFHRAKAIRREVDRRIVETDSLRVELAEARAKNDVLTRVINGIGYEHEKMAQVLSLQSHNAKLTDWINRVGFYFAGTDNDHVSKKALEILASQPDHELRDRVRAKLLDLSNRIQHSLTGDIAKDVEIELLELKEEIDQLLSSL